MSLITDSQMPVGFQTSQYTFYCFVPQLQINFLTHKLRYYYSTPHSDLCIIAQEKWSPY